jgi:hypothetical protein
VDLDRSVDLDGGVDLHGAWNKGKTWGQKQLLMSRPAMANDNKLQLQSITLSTTGYLRSSSPYHPHGAPIFPKLPPK